MLMVWPNACIQSDKVCALLVSCPLEGIVLVCNCHMPSLHQGVQRVLARLQGDLFMGTKINSAYQSAAHPFLSKNSEHAFFSATLGINWSALRGCLVIGSKPLALMCLSKETRSYETPVGVTIGSCITSNVIGSMSQSGTT